jgi:hypothetical protein
MDKTRRKTAKNKFIAIVCEHLSQAESNAMLDTHTLSATTGIRGIVSRTQVIAMMEHETSAIREIGFYDTEKRISASRQAGGLANELLARLSFAIPRVLTGVVRQLSEALYAIAKHAKSAAVPSLVDVRRALDDRSGRLAATALDAKFAAESLREHRKIAIPALKAVFANLNIAREALETS